ncbi:hypothetical protein JYG33_06245 [Alcaligenes sp. SORT26]|uniref:phospholipase D-like domain-containing protein n=1 Tax=Alcaligenes sp. SORT26 TaxID=2813780 RepID=UPI001A9D122B|nr:phospholipase D-like domain-containing protein [Alcaligenes sp. SORT26]QTC01052.1 hypothetical protein JYG33_06245 [Alcaligenes sp. SORT26]
MKIINSYFGHSLIETLENELQTDLGDRFDVGVGYAQNLTKDMFQRFCTALESWLEGDQQRKFRLFIGDHRHQYDKKDQQKAKVNACTLLPGELSNFGRAIEERMEVIFLERLHAKFYCMWSHKEDIANLSWAIIGSSNLTDAALEEKNVEMDIHFESSDPQIPSIQKALYDILNFIESDGNSDGDLHNIINEKTKKSRWENSKLRETEEWEAEDQAIQLAEELQEAEDSARRESDKRLGISDSA